MDTRADRPKERLTAQELSFYFGVSLDSLRAASCGRRPGLDLPAFEKVGGRIFYSRAAVEAWNIRRGNRGRTGKKH